jgi:hypothetical protein
MFDIEYVAVLLLKLLKNFIKILGISHDSVSMSKKRNRIGPIKWNYWVLMISPFPNLQAWQWILLAICYVVSDQTNQMYQINSVGQTVQTFGFTGNDLEGISYYKTGKFLLAEERTKNIVVYNPVDNTFESHLMSYENTDSNSGIEGVAYNPNTETIYFVNEKNPGKLFKTDAGFNISGIYDLNFDSDFSDVFLKQILIFYGF